MVDGLVHLGEASTIFDGRNGDAVMGHKPSLSSLVRAHDLKSLLGVPSVVVALA